MVNLRQAFKVHPDASGQLPPKETVNSRVMALGFFGAAAAIMYGYDLGWSPFSPLLLLAARCTC
jgi:hypothetical protein